MSRQTDSKPSLLDGRDRLSAEERRGADVRRPESAVQEPTSPELPFLLKLSHDDELRVCSQCGQDSKVSSDHHIVPRAAHPLALPAVAQILTRVFGCMCGCFMWRHDLDVARKMGRPS